MLLTAHEISKSFRLPRGLRARRLPAVVRASLAIERGETLALVGESGAGKSTLGRCLLGLTPLDSGYVAVDGERLDELSHRRRPHLRRRLQVVFQDPGSSLNPRLTVRAALCEPLVVHRLVPRAALAARVAALLEEVALPAELLDRFPHELSGGQRQRLALARALSVEPSLLVADEPTSSLDLPTQLQILLLLRTLQQRQALAVLLISHDLRMVAHGSHRVAVMVAGHLVESGPTDAVFASPRHPYTQELLAAAPSLDASPSQLRPPPRWAAPAARFPGEPGCCFLSRCPVAGAACHKKQPPLLPVAGHLVGCYQA
jgi:oligopeptide/dipeptide ABC transporter ATP-binding protein